MTQPGQPSILLVGNDPALEYLLKRYARQSGCEIRSIQVISPEIDLRSPRPISVWFTSLEVLAASQKFRANMADDDIPIVVCCSVADDVRATDLGADYHFLHPITYDAFLSTLAGTNQSQAENK